MPFKEININEMINKKISKGEIDKKQYQLVKQELELVMSIAKIRREKGISQKKLSDKSGLSQQTISRFENREYSPNLRNMIKIINALDLEIYLGEKKQ